eukprot:SAG11_NODE_366_length_10128_cov_4.162030_1_plen_1163_part_00
MRGEIESELLLAIRLLERQLEDVRDLEFEGEGDLNDDSYDARLLIVSNRLPISITQDSDGSVSWFKSSGGLVEALASISELDLPMCWIGWPGDEVDYEKQYEIKKQLIEESGYVPVFLTRDHEEFHYNGFCNDVLWPIFNYVPLNTSSAVLQEQFWDSYVSANQMFADTVFEIWQPGDIIWVHDYHLMLVPQMLRRKLPNVHLGFFLHTPYPTHEVFRVLPYGEKILEGLLNCDIVGFHCFSYARHFLRSCSEMLGLEVSPAGVVSGGKLVKVGIYPIGIDPRKWEANVVREPVVARIQELKAQFAGKKVLVGVDRMDPIKGLPHKLIAVETFLDRHPEWQGKLVLIQVAIPTRIEVEQYQKLNSCVSELVGRINSKFGKVDFNPIHYINRSINFDELCAMYTVADVLIVSSIRDGMNLVSFEYVACQEENHGVLLLSEFAGSAQSFSAAIQLNPWNINEMADAIQQAVEMTPEERTERHTLMSEYVHKYTSTHWSQTFVEDLRTFPTEDRGEELKKLQKLRKGDVFSAYHRSRKRLLLLGYEGTLVRVGSLPQLSKPNTQLLTILTNLCNDPRNTVFLVSGHTRAQMTAWFDELDIGLIAEHGCFLKWAGADTEWQQTVPPQDDTMREAVLPILTTYTSSVQGSYVYEKELSLTWAYHHAASEFGDWHANVLQNYLNEVLSNVPTDVIMSNRFLELRPYGVSTQSVLASMFENGAEETNVETDGQAPAAEPSSELLGQPTTARPAVSANAPGLTKKALSIKDGKAPHSKPRMLKPHLRQPSPQKQRPAKPPLPLQRSSGGSGGGVGSAAAAAAAVASKGTAAGKGKGRGSVGIVGGVGIGGIGGIGGVSSIGGIGGVSVGGVGGAVSLGGGVGVGSGTAGGGGDGSSGGSSGGGGGNSGSPPPLRTLAPQSDSKLSPSSPRSFINPKISEVKDAEEADYDFVFSVGDDRVDEFIFFTDPESCPVITKRLAPDAAQFYCLVNFRENSAASFYLPGSTSQAIQVVHSLSVASSKSIARQATAGLKADPGGRPPHLKLSGMHSALDSKRAAPERTSPNKSSMRVKSGERLGGSLDRNGRPVPSSEGIVAERRRTSPGKSSMNTRPGDRRVVMTNASVDTELATTDQPLTFSRPRGDRPRRGSGPKPRQMSSGADRSGTSGGTEE